MKARRLLPALAWWPLLFGFWVLLITVRSLAELLIGAGCAAVATAGVEAARRAGTVRLKPRAAWLLAFCKVPYRIVAESVTVAWLTAGVTNFGAAFAFTLR